MKRKERDRLLRRNDILGAAERVFAEKGFHGASVEEIAAASEYGVGTLYLYFKDKNEIYFSVLTEKLDELYGRICDAVEAHEEALEKLRAFVSSQLEYYDEKRDFFKLLVREHTSMGGEVGDKLHEMFKDNMKKLMGFGVGLVEGAVKCGDLRKDDPAELMMILTGMIRSSFFMPLFLNKKVDVRRSAERVFSLFVDGARKRAGGARDE